MNLFNKMPRIIRLILLFALALAPTALAALDAKIRVVDPRNNRAIADAPVIVIETRQRYYTDARGEAAISVPQPGFYTFRVLLPDGTLVQPRLEVRAAGQLVTILTAEAPRQQTTATETTTNEGGRGIVVTGSRGRSQLSRYQVRLDEVKRIPGQFGEALRGIETLPGVNAPAFGSGEIVIRGADDNANTYLLDDLPLGYAFHFFPLNSVLHNDFVKTIDIYTGAYPANYGNATGGVIAIESIDGAERLGGHASFSLWSANALFKAPIPAFGEDLETISGLPNVNPDAAAQSGAAGAPGASGAAPAAAERKGGGYWIGAVRASYLHETLKQFAPDGIRLPIYWDGQFKVMYRFTPEHSLYLYALGAKDTFAADVKDKGPQLDPTKEIDPIFIGANVAFEQAFHTEAIRHIWQPASKLQNRLTATYHNNIFYVQGQLGTLRANQKAEAGYVGIRNDLFWDPIPDHVGVEVGGEIRNFIYRNNGLTIRRRNPDDLFVDFYDTQNPDFETVTVRDSTQTQYNSGWTTLTLAGYGVEFKPGVRVDYFGLTRQTVADPRASLSYTFPTKTMLIGGAGVYHRAPDANEYSPTSGNPNLRFERAEHYGGGIQQEWLSWLFKVEFYRHYFDQTVVVDPYARTLVRENQDPFTRYERPFLINDSLGYSNDGTGWSEGYEIYIKKSKPEAENGWYGWVSYSYSRAFRNDHQYSPSRDLVPQSRSADETFIIAQLYDNTRDVIADFDRTHIVNVIFGYKFNAEWQLGARWRYSTGEPYTKIIGDDGGRQQNRGRRIYDPVFSQYRNGERLPDYHRLDLRIDRFLNYSWGYGNIFFEMLNVYARQNETGRNWDRSRPYSATNPTISYDFLLLQQEIGTRRALIPFFNMGIEVKF